MVLSPSLPQFVLWWVPYSFCHVRSVRCIRSWATWEASCGCAVRSSTRTTTVYRNNGSSIWESRNSKNLRREYASVWPQILECEWKLNNVELRRSTHVLRRGLSQLRNASFKTSPSSFLQPPQFPDILQNMSDIGPALPPHLLAKRKRKQEEEAEGSLSATSGAKQPGSPPNGEKRRKVVGPAMPPAPLDQKPTEPASKDEEESSDDDDGFGPALPSEVAQVCCA
jgi:hypothetical protein